MKRSESPRSYSTRDHQLCFTHNYTHALIVGRSQPELKEKLELSQGLYLRSDPTDPGHLVIEPAPSPLPGHQICRCLSLQHHGFGLDIQGSTVTITGLGVSDLLDGAVGDGPLLQIKGRFDLSFDLEKTFGDLFQGLLLYQIPPRDSSRESPSQVDLILYTRTGVSLIEPCS